MTTPFPSPPGQVPPQGKPDVGRAGCLAGSLAAAPFLLLAVGCLVLAVLAFNDPNPRPRPPRPSTTVRGTAPGTIPADDPSSTTTEPTPS